MSMKFGFKVDEGFSDAVLNAASGAISATNNAMKGVIREITEMAYGRAQELAAERLRSTRQQYINGLKFEEAGEGIFVLSLDPSVAYLEEGFSAFDMIKAGLARGAKSQLNKNNERFVRIPFEHSKGAASPSSPENKRPIQQSQGSQTTKGSLAADLKKLEQIFGANGQTKGPSGNDLTGKVWSMRKSTSGPQWNYQDALGRKDTQTVTGVSQLLSGLTKVQYEGKAEKTKSAYLTWRTATDKPGSGKWIHPGMAGAKIFPDVEKWIEEQFAAKVQELLSG